MRKVILLSLFLISCSANREVLKEEPTKHLIKEAEAPPPPPAPVELKPKKAEVIEKERVFSLTAYKTTLEKVVKVLADEAGLNLVFDEGVNKNAKVSVSIKNYTIEEALDAILSPLDYMYEIEGNTLRILAFKTKIFEINYIPSRISSEVQVGGDVLGTEKRAGLTGKVGISSSTDETTLDFWKQVEKSIKGLLSKDGKYAINQMTGTILVRDRRKNLEAVQKYIDELNSSLGRQVLLEAKVVELSFESSRATGVDWSALTSRVISGKSITISLEQTLGLEQPVFEMKTTTEEGEALLSALAKMGKLDVISNPRLSVTNGQTALISVGKIQAYWELTAQVAGGVQYGAAVVYPERKSVLIGLILGVTPFIEEDGEIRLQITPIVTDVVDWATYRWEGQTLLAPNVDIREASTVIKAKEGETVIIGGLLTKKKNLVEKKVPLLGDIPILGYLFKRHEWQERKAELVIFLTPKEVKINE